MYDLSTHEWTVHNKAWGKQFSTETIESALSIFFRKDNRLQPALLRSAIDQLCELRKCVRQCNWRFWSSSVLLTRSADASSCVRLHLIDFGNGNFSGKYESSDEVGVRKGRLTRRDFCLASITLLLSSDIC